MATRPPIGRGMLPGTRGRRRRKRCGRGGPSGPAGTRPGRRSGPGPGWPTPPRARPGRLQGSRWQRPRSATRSAAAPTAQGGRDATTPPRRRRQEIGRPAAPSGSPAWWPARAGGRRSGCESLPAMSRKMELGSAFDVGEADAVDLHCEQPSEEVLRRVGVGPPPGDDRGRRTT